MRIGISCIKYGSGDHGGVQIFLRSYIEALSRIDKSENEYILIFDKNVNLESMAISNSFKSFVIDTEREINFFFRILKRLFKHTIFYQYLPLYYSEKISKQLSDLNLDVIHFPATTIDIPFELPLNCKKIITFHDLQHEFFPEFFRVGKKFLESGWCALSRQVRLLVQSTLHHGPLLQGSSPADGFLLWFATDLKHRRQPAQRFDNRT